MDSDLQILHDASMRILSKIGMRFHHPEALELFSSHGVNVSGDRVRLSEETIMEWVCKTPASFKIFARNPRYDVAIGGDATELAPSYGATKIVLPDGLVRQATLSDFASLAAIYQQSVNFNINGGILVQPSDLPAGVCRPAMLHSLLANSDKTILGVGGGVEEAEKCMTILEIVFGHREEIADKPRSIHLVNTLSPLQMDHDALGAMLFYARWGQPLIVSPGIIAGSTGPMTLAGSIALGNAEALAVIALAQMANPGTPVVYGALSGEADMRTGGPASGSPTYALSFGLTARLAKAYGLPCRSGGTPTDAPNLSPQSGYEAMMTLMATYSSRVNLALHAGGMVGSYAGVSFEKLMVDLEIIAMVKRYQEGISICADDLALEVIDEVGPGGNFLSHGHTFKNFRKVVWQPTLAQRGQIGDSSKYMDLIARSLDRVRKEHEPCYLPDDKNKEITTYLKRLGWDKSGTLRSISDP